MSASGPSVYLVTGGASGIGLATAQELAGRGAHLILGCRSVERARPVVERLQRDSGNERIELLPFDLASLSSVRAAAASFLARGLPLHGLVNNAGLVARGLTGDGFELIFGVCHVGHFLLTSLLAERLRDSAPARVVSVSSKAHFAARALDFQAVRRRTATWVGMREYSVAKLANVLHAAELARRCQGRGVTTYAVHPGVISTEIWRRIPWPARSLARALMKSPEEGARTVVDCLTSEARAGETGLYYDDCRVTTASPLAQDRALAGELWERSTGWVSQGAGPGGST
jgi:retinol dehydrogenase-12